MLIKVGASFLVMSDIVIPSDFRYLVKTGVHPCVCDPVGFHIVCVTYVDYEVITTSLLSLLRSWCDVNLLRL